MEDALSVHCVLFTFTSPHRRLQTEYPGFSSCWLLSGHGSGLGGCTEKAQGEGPHHLRWPSTNN